MDKYECTLTNIEKNTDNNQQRSLFPPLSLPLSLSIYIYIYIVGLINDGWIDGAKEYLKFFMSIY